MPSMAERSSTSVIPAPDRAPNSWGFGRRAGDPVGVRAGARGARHRHAQGALRPVHQRPVRAGHRRRHVRLDRPVDRAAAGRGRPRHRGRCRQGRPRRAPRPAPVLGPAVRPRAGQVPVPHLADPPGALARVRGPRIDGLGQADQGERATSTCRSPRTTSGTTRAGRTSSTTRSPAASRGRSAWPRRSSRGTSRC